MPSDRTTLGQFLIEEQRQEHLTDTLAALVRDLATACQSIAERVAHGSLVLSGSADSVNIQGEQQHTLDVAANDAFIRATETRGHLAGMVSEEMEAPHPIPRSSPRGPYLLLFDPLDGSSNIDVNVSVGSIFSILHAPNPDGDVAEIDFLQPGSRQVCAGYAIYGPSTVLVLTLGAGVHAFTLDRGCGEFILTHRNMRIPQAAGEFAINASNRRFWEPPVTRYIDECLAGKAGPRGKDFNMRWIASLVAEAHRILMRGGVFLYPRDNKVPVKAGRLRLLYEANPIAFIIEQAGGLASTGRQRIRDVVPDGLHQRIALIFGAAEEVERIEAYHAAGSAADNGAELTSTGGV